MADNNNTGRPDKNGQYGLSAMRELLRDCLIAEESDAFAHAFLGCFGSVEEAHKALQDERAREARERALRDEFLRLIDFTIIRADESGVFMQTCPTCKGTGTLPFERHRP